MRWWFLAFCVLSLAAALNVLHPPRRPRILALLAFVSGWLTGELALPHALLQALVAAAFVASGGLSTGVGRAGLGLLALGWALLFAGFLRARRLGAVFAAALRDGLGEGYEDQIAPELRDESGSRPRSGIERQPNVVYFEEGRLRLRLEIWRPSVRPANAAPALIYVHGGAWVLGRKEQQGQPLLRHLAARGWVCFNIDYRLSPRATFPDHLVDVKRAIAWVRAHAAEHGVDPGFLVLAGGSAGGHLAALAALTPGDRTFQPGFEDADTRVAGCVPIYGIYDLRDRFGHWPHRGMQDLLERFVFKATLADAPLAFEQASPVARLTASAPPFLVVHGTHDTMVPVAEARAFTAEFRATCEAPMVYVEVPGAQHAFEVFPSLRTAQFLAGTTRFLFWLWSRHRG